jgi:hypothetical protein
LSTELDGLTIGVDEGLSLEELGGVTTG